LRNKIINGNFTIWQRGTSIAAATTYTADQWTNPTIGAQVSTITRETDVPASVNANFSLKTAITTANASPAAGDLHGITQIIEGYNFLSLKGKAITLSFWVKSSLTGTYSVSFRNGGNTRSYVTTYSISSANTWEQKTISLTHDTTGTWDYTSGAGLRVTFTLMSGTTARTSTLNSWQAGFFIASTSQVNFDATIGNTFFLSQVQLEEATPVGGGFEFLDFNQELRLCQRYYEKSVPHDVTAFTDDSAAHSTVGGSVNDTATPVTYLVEKRASPTVTVYAASSGTVGAIRNRTTSADVTTVTTSGTSDAKGFYVYKVSSITVGSWYGYNWTSSAEL
jgi:hypothetical protein